MSSPHRATSVHTHSHNAYSHTHKTKKVLRHVANAQLLAPASFVAVMSRTLIFMYTSCAAPADALHVNLCITAAPRLLKEKSGGEVLSCCCCSWRLDVLLVSKTCVCARACECVCVRVRARVCVHLYSFLKASQHHYPRRHTENACDRLPDVSACSM